MSQELQLEPLDPRAESPAAPASDTPPSLRRLSAVPVELTVEMGRTRMTVGETLEIRQGSIITLNRMAGEPVDLLVNGAPIARGEVVVIDEQFGLRVTEMIVGGSREDSPGEPGESGEPGEAVEAPAPPPVDA